MLFDMDKFIPPRDSLPHDMYLVLIKPNALWPDSVKENQTPLW